jgi:hypothetical protein
MYYVPVLHAVGCIARALDPPPRLQECSWGCCGTGQFSEWVSWPRRLKRRCWPLDSDGLGRGAIHLPTVAIRGCNTYQFAQGAEINTYDTPLPTSCIHQVCLA